MKNHLSAALRKQITIQKPLQLEDQAGGMVTEWQTHCHCFAHVQSIGNYLSDEVLQAMQIESRGYYAFLIRYREGITHDMRIIYRNRLFHIKRLVNENELNITLKIITEEGK